jgi:uncharacterized iron-regulated membrane protein
MIGKRIRTCFFWTHLVVGLLAGIVVLMLCVTGALLALERQIIDLAEHDARALPPSASAERVSPAVLMANAARLHSSKISNIEWMADPRMPARVYFEDRSVALLNSWTGELLGHGADSLRAFFRTTTNVHVNLTLLGTGKWLVDVANAAFVFLILSGLWLWWPRHWRWKALRSSIAIRFAVQGKARDWNWHNALGFWSMLPLLVLAASGLVLSFKPVDQWWRAFAVKHFLAQSRPTTVPSAAGSASPGWNGAMNAVIQQCPGWRSMLLMNSSRSAQGIANLMVCTGTFGQRALVRNVSVDQASNAIVKVKAWENEDASGRARVIARFGHSGEIVGLWGQVLALLACLGGILLVYTGFALSWRRFFPRRNAAVSTTKN